MTDFYSVLRQSIESRDLHTVEERKQVYEQARKAMIRKLWSNEPRLPEDEIASRIAAFDAAVDRIEGDFEPLPSGPAGLAVPEPRRQAAAPIVEGYDDEADYAPASGGRAAAIVQAEEAPAEKAPARRAPTPSQPARQVQRALPPPEPEHKPDRRRREVEDLAPLADDDPLPSLFSRRDPPVERGPPVPAEKLWRDDHSDLAFDDNDADEAALDESDAQPRRRRVGLPQRLGARLPALRGKSLPQFGNLRLPKLPALGLPRLRGMPLPDLGERQLVQLLAGVIAILAIFLVGFGIYVLYPRSTGPAIAEASGGVSRKVSDAATAAEIPQEELAVAESFKLFDGRDPQVFYSTPDNPIRFDKDDDGGFTRVSTTSGAAGARAVIGPGLATRLAGHTIRVTLLARSSKDAGAENLRFAYQSGVAISHWQVANVTDSYSEIGLIWRVPAQRTSSRGDVLLIEPGIPGDGSGVDIKSIRIDLIAQG